MKLSKIKLGIITLAALATFIGFTPETKAYQKPTRIKVAELDTKIDKDIQKLEKQKDADEEETYNSPWEEEDTFSDVSPYTRPKHGILQIGLRGITGSYSGKNKRQTRSEMQPFFNLYHRWSKQKIKSPDVERYPLTFVGREGLNLLFHGPGSEGGNKSNAVVKGNAEVGIIIAKYKDTLVEPFYQLDLNADTQGLLWNNTINNSIGLKIRNPKQGWQIGIKGIDNRCTGFNQNRHERLWRRLRARGLLQGVCDYTELQPFFNLYHRWSKQKIKSPDVERYPLTFVGREKLNLLFHGPGSEGRNKNNAVANVTAEAGIILLNYKNTFVEPFYQLGLNADTKEGSDTVSNSIGIKVRNPKKHWQIGIKGSNTYRKSNSVMLTFTLWNGW